MSNSVSSDEHLEDVVRTINWIDRSSSNLTINCVLSAIQILRDNRPNLTSTTFLYLFCHLLILFFWFFCDFCFVHSNDKHSHNQTQETKIIKSFVWMQMFRTVEVRFNLSTRYISTGSTFGTEFIKWLFERTTFIHFLWFDCFSFIWLSEFRFQFSLHPKASSIKVRLLTNNLVERMQVPQANESIKLATKSSAQPKSRCLSTNRTRAIR